MKKRCEWGNQSRVKFVYTGKQENCHEKIINHIINHYDRNYNYRPNQKSVIKRISYGQSR